MPYLAEFQIGSLVFLLACLLIGFRAKKILIWANSARALISIVLLCAFIAGLLNEAMLLIFSFLIATFTMIDAPAFNALLPQLVTKKHTLRANALTDNSKRMARLLGSLMSAFLGQVVAVPWYYLIISLNFLMTGTISSMFSGQKVVILNRDKPTMRYLLNSILLVGKYKPILIVVLCFSVYNISYGAGFVLLPILFGSEMGFGVEGYSAVIAGYASGAILSSFYFNMRNPIKIIYLPFLGFFLFALSLVFIAFSTNLSLAFIVGLFGGVGLPMMDIFVPTLIHFYGKPEHLGRIYAGWRMLVDIGMSIGFVLAGVLAEILSPSIALIVLSAPVLPVILFIGIKMNYETSENISI